MAYHSKYTGAEVDALLDKVESGDVGGKVTVDSALSTESENPVMNRVITEELEYHNMLIEDLYDTKIDKEADDYYPQLAVGLADNLAGVDVVDSEVNFRRSGGGAISDGVARIEAIKGNSVVWNQLYDRPNQTITNNGMTSIKNADGSLSISGTLSLTYATVGQFNGNIENHTYLFMLVGSKTLDGKRFALLNRNAGAAISSGFAYFFHKNTDTSLQRQIGFSDFQVDEVVNDTFFVRQIDLTKMFRAGNEPTTIEEFYARIPMGVDMNAYNEGEVIHMDVQSIESVGVNAWGGSLFDGYVNDNTGAILRPDISGYKSTGFVRVLPNTQYYIRTDATSGRWGAWYDKDQNHISGIAGAGIHTSPSNAAYMRMTIVHNNNGNTDTFCINLSDTSINGKYFPYVKRTEDLSIIRKYFPQGMKSAGTAHDEIRYNKATQKWERVERIGSVGMGNYAFYKDSSRDFFKAIVDGMLAKQNYVCAKYNNIKYAELGSVKGIFLNIESTRCIISISDPSYGDDYQKFRQDLQGVMLYYELAEPIVTELDAEDQFKDLDYQVWNLGTEKAIAEGKSAPLAADITYGFNAIGKIKELEEIVKALQSSVLSLASNNQ